MQMSTTHGSGCFDEDYDFEDYEVEDEGDDGGAGDVGGGGEATAVDVGDAGDPGADDATAVGDAAADDAASAGDTTTDDAPAAGTDDAAPEAGADDAAPTGLPSDDTPITVKVDGADVEVTFGEVKAGYMRQADYTRKTQALATDRAKVDQDRADVQQLEENWLRMITGDDDPIAKRDTRIQELESEVAQLKEAGVAADEDQPAAVAKAKELWDREKETLTTERDTAKQELQGFEDAILKEYQSYLAGWMAENAYDLVADESTDLALKMFLDLHAQGHEVDEALKMTRVKYPAPDDNGSPQKVPDSIAAQNMGDRDTTRNQGDKDLRELNEELRRETTEIAAWPGG